MASNHNPSMLANAVQGVGHPMAQSPGGMGNMGGFASMGAASPAMTPPAPMGGQAPMQHPGGMFGAISAASPAIGMGGAPQHMPMMPPGGAMQPPAQHPWPMQGQQFAPPPRGY